MNHNADGHHELLVTIFAIFIVVMADILYKPLTMETIGCIVAIGSAFVLKKQITFGKVEVRNDDSEG